MSTILITCQMSSLVISVLCVLPFLCTHCQAQEFPYVSFNGTIYANHSYLDLTLVGEGGENSSNEVLCHTSVQTCCSGSQGVHRGDWYFPSGSRLPFPDHGMNAIAQQREAQRVELSRRNNRNVSGIYRCDIPITVTQNQSLYIGLYASGGKFNTID